MSEITTVVLDAMGGDNAPAAMIDGAIDAISKEKNVKVILVGIEDVIRKGLEGKTYNPEQIEIVNATEVIETAEPPVNAIRRKKDSSIVVGMKLVKDGGFLATCSCSHFMKEELFVKMLQDAAHDANVSLRQIEARQQSPDHPILWQVPETNYLKFYIFQVV